MFFSAQPANGNSESKDEAPAFSTFSLLSNFGPLFLQFPQLAAQAFSVLTEVHRILPELSPENRARVNMMMYKALSSFQWTWRKLSETPEARDRLVRYFVTLLAYTQRLANDTKAGYDKALTYNPPSTMPSWIWRGLGSSLGWIMPVEPLSVNDPFPFTSGFVITDQAWWNPGFGTVLALAQQKCPPGSVIRFWIPQWTQKILVLRQWMYIWGGRGPSNPEEIEQADESKNIIWILQKNQISSFFESHHHQRRDADLLCCQFYLKGFNEQFRTLMNVPIVSQVNISVPCKWLRCEPIWQAQPLILSYQNCPIEQLVEQITTDRESFLKKANAVPLDEEKSLVLAPFYRMVGISSVPKDASPATAFATESIAEADAKLKTLSIHESSCAKAAEPSSLVDEATPDTIKGAPRALDNPPFGIPLSVDSLKEVPKKPLEKEQRELDEWFDCSTDFEAPLQL